MENRFGLGPVMGTGFRIWFKNLPAFLLLTLVAYIPLLIWGITASIGTPEQHQLFILYHGAADSLLGVLASASITYGVVMELQGQHASLGTAFATGLARFFPALLVAILSWICIGFGLVLLIVPGLIWLCMFYVAGPAIVLERPGITGALGRSRALTKGHKLEIFGLVILISMVSGGISYVAQQLLVHGDMDTPELMDLATMNRYIYVQIGLSIITGSLYAVMQAVSYYYLRAEKEGTTATELARIFE